MLGLLRLAGRLVGGALLIAYLLVSRSLVVVLGLYLTIYFLVGSRPFKDAIQEVIAANIPGTIAAATVQLGPVPWHLRIAEGRVYGSRGEEVIRVKAVEASIDWGATLEGLVAWLDDPGAHPFTVHFDRVDLLEPWARVEIGEDDFVGIERAFVAHDEPEGAPGPPATFDIRSRVVRVMDGGTLVESPGFRLEASGATAVTDFALTGEDHMAYDVPRTRVANVRMTFTTFSHLPAPLVIDARDVVVDDFAWRGLGFTWRKAVGRLEGGRFEGTGGLDAAPARPTWFGHGTVWLDDGAAALATLARDTTSGPLEVSIGGAGDVYQLFAGWRVASPELRVGPLLLGDLVATGRFTPRGTPEEDQLHAVHVDTAIARLGGGQVEVIGLDYEPRGVGTDASRDLQLTVAARGVDVGPPLTALFDLPLLPPARWSGAARFTLTERPDAEWSHMALTLAPDLPSDTLSLPPPPDALEIAWSTAPLPGLPATWLVEGGFERLRAPLSTLAGLADPPPAPLVDALALRGLQLDAGPHRARLAGTIDLARGRLDLEPYLRLGEVGPLARELGLGDAAGRLVMKAARLTGPIEDPRLDGTINWTQARLGTRQLDQVVGRVSFVDGALVVDDLTSKGPLARFALDGRVALFEPPAPATPAWLPSARMPFTLEARALEGVLAAALTPVFGPDARIALDHGSFSGALLDPRGPLESLSGEGRVIITQAVVGGEPGVRLEATLTLRPGLDLLLEDVRVVLQSGATWTARLHVGPARNGDPRTRPLEGRLDLGETSLADLRPLALAAPGLEARVRARVTIAGTVGAPSFIGTIDVDDASYGGIQLGDASLAVSTRADGDLRVVELGAFDESFFPGFSLERAALTLAGLSPRRLEAVIRARDKRLGDFVAAARDQPFEVLGSASAELELDLVTRLLNLRLRALPDELALVARERNLRWSNATELLLVNDAGRFVLHPVTLRPSHDRSPDAPHLEACGRFDARRFDLQLAGTVELALLPGLGDLFSVSQGRFVIAPDPAATRAIGDDTCLQGTNAILHLGGRLDAPAAVGRVDTRGLALVPRGSGREIRIRDGASLLLREVDGRQRVELGADDARFEGDLDDGSFGLTGHVDFEGFAPSALDVRLVGADLFVQSAGEFAVTMSPTAHIVATGLTTPSPSVQVSGDIALSEGRFSKSFDTFARAVGGALGAREDTYSTSLLDELPWLGATRLDLNIVASDFQIQAALPLARTDLPARLDLTLRGTLAEPRIFRRVDLLPGGTLAYFVFERTFTVTQGAIDFDGAPEHPLVEVTAQTPITYLQRAQTALQEEDEKEVTITLRMTGRVPDLKIELSSDDATLDQADIQSLLITGKPRGDLDRAQESRLVSADLANVINTVLSAPFVRRASVGFDQKGGLEYRVGTCFAPNLCFDTTTVSDDTETTLRAKFSLSIGDDVVCEGTLRRSDSAATSMQETYEARCRYRIPLE